MSQMSDQYYYDIDEKRKAFAAKKLNEDPSQVNSHIESLRKWVTSVRHLHCPTDAKFLLRFLRVSKFNEAKARKRIQSFCEAKTSNHDLLSYFKSYNVDHPLVDAFLKMKIMVPFGKIDSGEIIALIRYNIWDPDICPFADVIKIAVMAYDVLATEDVDSQIFGFKLIFDFQGISKENLDKLCDAEIWGTIYFTLQNDYSLRFKEQIFFTDSDEFEVLYKIIFSLLNDKMKRRSSWVKKDLKTIMHIYPELEKISPKEYNGHGKTLDEYADSWNETFRSFYENDRHPFHQFSGMKEPKLLQDTSMSVINEKDGEGDAEEGKGGAGKSGR